jgi:hypothetical protein
MLISVDILKGKLIIAGLYGQVMRGHDDGIIHFRYEMYFFEKRNANRKHIMFQCASIDRYVVRARTIGVRDTCAVAMVAQRVTGTSFGCTATDALDLRKSPVMDNVIDEGQTVARKKEIE